MTRRAFFIKKLNSKPEVVRPDPNRYSRKQGRHKKHKASRSFDQIKHTTSFMTF